MVFSFLMLFWIFEKDFMFIVAVSIIVIYFGTREAIYCMIMEHSKEMKHQNPIIEALIVKASKHVGSMIMDYTRLGTCACSRVNL